MKKKKPTKNNNKNNIDDKIEQCKPCTVHINRIEHNHINDILEQQQQQEEQSNINKTSHTHYRTEHRLKAKENGMVMLPRTFYNSHPAHRTLTRSSNNNTSASSNTRSKDKSGRSTRTSITTPARFRHAESTPKSNKRPQPKKPKPRKSTKEYRLMFIQPEEVTDVESEVKVAGPIGGGLARLATDENLPSDKWKIERIYSEKTSEGNAKDQPYDAIDAELEALMSDDRKPAETDDNDKGQDEPKQAEEYPSIMDILNEPSENPEEAASKRSEAPEPPKKDRDEELESVVFKRVGDDVASPDRTVAFLYNLEYTVKIGDKKVELLGAPELITSGEDLKILLQIVDDLDPACGCLNFCDS